MRNLKAIGSRLAAVEESLLQTWRSSVRARLWYVDDSLVARDGIAYRCAEETVRALERHMLDQESGAPVPDPAEPSEGEAEPEPQSIEGLLTEAEKALVARAEAWCELPIPWADLRVLIALLSESATLGLRDHGAGAVDLEIVTAAFRGLATVVADRRVIQLEEEIAGHREEAVATQHMAGRFLANASHELRTPLTAVLGFSDLLLESTYGELNPGQRKAVGHIENSAANLLEIVNNLLDLLHIRSGKLTLQYRSVNLAQLLQNLYDILFPLSERKNVGFSLELPDDLGVIEADENILRHIVYHLVASALRATPPDGRVHLTAERGETCVTIITHDTALHLPPEAIANMMDPFPILENSPARGYEGWEVGLPLVRRYIDIHGGNLKLQSLPERGTTFTITLPISRSVKGPGNPCQPAPDATG